jgi:hypothetical protein
VPLRVARWDPPLFTEVICNFSRVGNGDVSETLFAIALLGEGRVGRLILLDGEPLSI